MLPTNRPVPGTPDRWCSHDKPGTTTHGPSPYATHVNPDDAAEFFMFRSTWLRTITYRNQRGTWDVGFYVDGHYVNEGDAEATAVHFQRWLDTILGRPH